MYTVMTSFFIYSNLIWIFVNLQTRDPCRQAIWEFEILIVVNLYILETITHIHLKSLLMATTNTQSLNYNTRHASVCCLPVHHLVSTEKKPTYVGVKLLKDLPEDNSLDVSSGFNNILFTPSKIFLFKHCILINNLA